MVIVQFLDLLESVKQGLFYPDMIRADELSEDVIVPGMLGRGGHEEAARGHVLELGHRVQVLLPRASVGVSVVYHHALTCKTE